MSNKHSRTMIRFDIIILQLFKVKANQIWWITFSRVASVMLFLYQMNETIPANATWLKLDSILTLASYCARYNNSVYKSAKEKFVLYEAVKYQYINLLKSNDFDNTNCTINLIWSFECSFEKVKVVSVKNKVVLFRNNPKIEHINRSLFIVKGAAWHMQKNWTTVKRELFHVLN